MCLEFVTEGIVRCFDRMAEVSRGHSSPSDVTNRRGTTPFRGQRGVARAKARTGMGWTRQRAVRWEIVAANPAMSGLRERRKQVKPA